MITVAPVTGIFYSSKVKRMGRARRGMGKKGTSRRKLAAVQMLGSRNSREKVP